MFIYSAKMTSTLPYFSSANEKLKKYFEEVKIKEYNEAYQQANLNIYIDGQFNLASQAEIMNKLNELQKEISKQTFKNVTKMIKSESSKNTIDKDAEEIKSVMDKLISDVEEQQKILDVEEQQKILEKKAKSAKKAKEIRAKKKQEEDIKKKQNPESDNPTKRGRPFAT